MGAIALTAGLMLDLDKAAELVNFGACAGFMVVNLSVIGYYFVRRRERGLAALWSYLFLPIAGFLVCLRIWLSVSPLAMRVGTGWTLAGLLYLFLLVRRHGLDLKSNQSAGPSPL